jgi:hypothetical protein
MERMGEAVMGNELKPIERTLLNVAIILRPLINKPPTQYPIMTDCLFKQVAGTKVIVDARFQMFYLAKLLIVHVYLC